MRFRTICLTLFLVLGLAGGVEAADKATTAAAERLMQTLDLEKRVDGVVQLYVALAPAGTPEQAGRVQALRERAPGAGGRFRKAVVRAAVRHFDRADLMALDGFFASDEGQRTLTTSLARALFSVGRGSHVKAGDILKPEDFADQPALRRAAAKYPAFEDTAKLELAREFAPELALIVAR